MVCVVRSKIASQEYLHCKLYSLHAAEPSLRSQSQSISQRHRIPARARIKNCIYSRYPSGWSIYGLTALRNGKKLFAIKWLPHEHVSQKEDAPKVLFRVLQESLGNPETFSTCMQDTNAFHNQPRPGSSRCLKTSKEGVLPISKP